MEYANPARLSPPRVPHHATPSLRTVVWPEDEMQSVDGKVSKFLYNASGILNGFVLGRGQEIRFWISDANVGAVTETMTVGSRVEVQGDPRRDAAGEEYLRAYVITNLDSKRTAS